MRAIYTALAACVIGLVLGATGAATAQSKNDEEPPYYVGQVLSVTIDSDGRGYVVVWYLDAATIGVCWEDGNVFGFDTNSSAGRAMMSLALTAKASRAKLLVTGSGTCGHYANIQDLASGRIE